MIRTARALILLLLLALMCGGCGGGAPVGPPTPAPAPSGYFVGLTDTGLGVAVDLVGFDPTAQAVSRALLDYPRPTALAIVSYVNSSGGPVPQPQLLAQTPGERMVPLVDVRVLLSRIPGAAARAARLRIRPPAAVLGRGSRLVYLAAVDVRPEEVVGIRMTTVDQVVGLSARRR